MSINIFYLAQTLAGKKGDGEESRKRLEQTLPGHIQYSRDVPSAFPQGYKHFCLIQTPCLIYSRITHTLFLVT